MSQTEADRLKLQSQKGAAVAKFEALRWKRIRRAMQATGVLDPADQGKK